MKKIFDNIIKLYYKGQQLNNDYNNEKNLINKANLNKKLNENNERFLQQLEILENILNN